MNFIGARKPVKNTLSSANLDAAEILNRPLCPLYNDFAMSHIYTWLHCTKPQHGRPYNILRAEVETMDIFSGRINATIRHADSCRAVLRSGAVSLYPAISRCPDGISLGMNYAARFDRRSCEL